MLFQKKNLSLTAKANTTSFNLKRAPRLLQSIPHSPNPRFNYKGVSKNKLTSVWLKINHQKAT